MNISHIEHIGIAVKSIEEARKYYEEVLGLTCYAVEEVKDQKVKTAFFQVGDLSKVVVKVLNNTLKISVEAPVFFVWHVFKQFLFWKVFD